MQRKPRYLPVELPDREATIDFMSHCQVKLELLEDEPGEPARLRVFVQGLDDRETILLDKMLILPEPDDPEKGPEFARPKMKKNK